MMLRVHWTTIGIALIWVVVFWLYQRVKSCAVDERELDFDRALCMVLGSLVTNALLIIRILAG